MILIRNAEIYTPKYIGKKDVLICGEKIECIKDSIENLPEWCEIIDGENKILTPGLIDQHVHITGGGGEGGFHTRTPELNLSEMIKGGITTVIGLLGTDGLTRSIENLYAKAAALTEEGVSAYMLTGAYGYPSPTITGEIDKDIVFIKEILGVKLAISDHRAPNVTEDELIQIASKARVAGMLSGKPGIVVLHMGDAECGLKPVFRALSESSVPIRIFRPTHVNRNENLLEEAYRFLEKGGYIDLTCAINEHFAPGECIVKAVERGLSTEHITISSDGHGSWSEYAQDGTLLKIGVSKVDALYNELTFMVKELGMPLEKALPYMTSQVAEALDLLPEKGVVKEGSDADLLLLEKDMTLSTYIAKGKVFMKEKKLIRNGTYE